MPTPTCPHLERGTPHKGHSEGLQVPIKVAPSRKFTQLSIQNVREQYRTEVGQAEVPDSGNAPRSTSTTLWPGPWVN